MSRLLIPFMSVFLLLGCAQQRDGRTGVPLSGIVPPGEQVRIMSGNYTPPEKEPRGSRDRASIFMQAANNLSTQARIDTPTVRMPGTTNAPVQPASAPSTTERTSDTQAPVTTSRESTINRRTRSQGIPVPPRAPPFPSRNQVQDNGETSSVRNSRNALRQEPLPPLSKAAPHQATDMPELAVQRPLTR